MPFAKSITTGAERSRKVVRRMEVYNEDPLSFVPEDKSFVSIDNSTSTPLGANSTFTGIAEDVESFVDISVSVYSDQDSATDGLSIQFSADGTNWYWSDAFSIMAGSAKPFTAGIRAKWFRVVYVNGAIAQTEFQIASMVFRSRTKPSSHRISDPIIDDDDAELVTNIIKAKNPDGEFINVCAEQSGALRFSVEDGQTGNGAQVEPLGALKVESPVRLVGTTFSNGTKDPNFWTETVVGSGTVTQAGQITLSTGTTADSSAKYETVRKARKITGCTNQFRAIAALTTIADEDNIRRIGSYFTGGDGFFFQANGTVMQVCSMNTGVITAISSGNFNGNYGTTWEPELNTIYRLVIDFTAGSAKFFVNGILLHMIQNTVAGYVNTQNFPVTMENINSNGNTTDNTFLVQFATILRLGNLITNPAVEFIGTNITTVLKYNAGTLQRIVNLDNAGDVTIYDNTTATGTQIGVIDTAKALGTLEFNAPFSNGLTIVTSGGAKITVIYE